MGAKSGWGRSSRWTFRFVGMLTAMPDELLGVGAADACLEHVGKLARTLLACLEAFPFHTCPGVALSAAGAKALGLYAREMFEALGLPFPAGTAIEF